MSSNFDPKQILLDKIKANGGWVNAHAHIDRAYILNDENFKLVDGDLKQKWDYLIYLVLNFPSSI